MKYPVRSNWYRVPIGSFATLGSILAPGTKTSEAGLSVAVNSWPSPTASGSGTVNSLSYSRTSTSRACRADTQWMVPCTLGPSGASPPRVAGSYVQRSSTTLPDASLMTSVQVMKYPYRSQISLPGGG